MTTYVEYFQHARGWSAFVINQNTRKHVRLGLVDNELLNRIEKWVTQVEKKNRVALAEWIKRERLHDLYEAFIAPLQPYLPPASQQEQLVLAPYRLLNQLPMSAALNPETDAYLIDEYLLAFSDGLAFLPASQHANRQWRQPQSPLHIAYSGSQHYPPTEWLQKATESAADMAQILPTVICLTEENATLENIVAHLPNRDALCFFCHGIFKPNNPAQSGLLLYDGYLTKARILKNLDLSQTYLIALVACQSGRSSPNNKADLIQALLAVNSKVVLATLWRVSELPTLAFLKHFYTAVKKGFSPAEALADATQKIRHTTGWEHPYYWAAFTLISRGYRMPSLNVPVRRKALQAMP